MDTPMLRKARGAFYTPPEMAEFLCRWAIRSVLDRVLEPSCGDAAFLLPSAAYLAQGGAPPRGLSAQIVGVDVHSGAAMEAEHRLTEAGYAARIIVGDFFDQAPSAEFDAVVGNPPYVRYQSFSGSARAKGLKAALVQGVRLNGLASSWAAFTVHAAQFLKPDGRLGLVLPAELLSVKYAEQVRRFLLERFATVRLILFEQRVFDGVMEEVVLLMAEGSGGTDHFEVYQARNLGDLLRIETSNWTGYTPVIDEKWTPALLPVEALEVYKDILGTAHFTPLMSWGNTYLGAVTGNNKFFTLSRVEAATAGLAESDLLRISPPGGRHLRGLKFTEAAWESLARDGSRCFLFYPAKGPLSPAAHRYIDAGAAAGVDKGYKCRNRVPWWRVPIVGRPDLFFTYMNHERPRLTTNEANVQLLNSLYGISLEATLTSLGREFLPVACLNSLTLLGAEVVGRSYGGGLLKHEPREADRLPVPSVATVEATAPALRLVRPQLTTALRNNRVDEAAALIDRIILEEHLGLDVEQIKRLHDARAILFRRRMTRARRERGAD